MTVYAEERHGRSRRRLDHLSELGAAPAPGAVGDNVGRVGFEWSVVGVELARLVSGTVVVRVTELALSGVSWVLSWHVLSAER